MSLTDGTNVQASNVGGRNKTQNQVRDVLGEIQLMQQAESRRSPAARENEKMDTNQENDENAIDAEQRSDWSSLRTALEAAFGAMGHGATGGTHRGATIRTKADKGHLLYVCKDDCFNETRLGDLKGIQFPGAVAKQPIGSMWNAWRAASIFVRTDIDTASKIKFWKDGAMCLDEEALGKVLRVAYDRCLDWTEFICVTEGIKKHEKIDAYGFEKTYDSALKKLKSELQTEEKERRPIKEGPTAFAAPASAALLEKDGPRRGISTKVTTTFKQLRELSTSGSLTRSGL
ncbi:hypothetical protein Y032_0009g745 [Ancylostoma ceylanicum]|uniref:Uncharacterized protein n=1 Tax=Ancylostoma ceylanicum TaxID=53326 RepID=A0A016VIM2_9BILA|nr:hypothetical protein Y032_0009g745 [Ancylostoma ceylanicum]